MLTCARPRAPERLGEWVRPVWLNRRARPPACGVRWRTVRADGPGQRRRALRPRDRSTPEPDRSLGLVGQGQGSEHSSPRAASAALRGPGTWAVNAGQPVPDHCVRCWTPGVRVCPAHGAFSGSSKTVLRVQTESGEQIPACFPRRGRTLCLEPSAQSHRSFQGPTIHLPRAAWWSPGRETGARADARALGHPDAPAAA